MKHGELKEYIAAGTTRDDFMRRVQNSFNISPPPAPAQPSSDALSSSPPSSSISTGVPPTVERSDNVRRVLEERAAKQQAEKEATEQKAKEELAKNKAKAEAEAEAGANAQRQAELLKKHKLQESEERRRILKRIQDDKEERRKQAAERELQRMEHQPRSDSSSPVATASPSRVPSSTKAHDFTSIQVRLFDGSTIRSRFKTASPVKDVRKWVDESRTDGDLPYAFRQLLTPLPNRPVDDTEENRSLGEIGLAPSSTLILVPVRSYAPAYGGSPQGFFPRMLGLILGFFTWFFALFGLGGEGRSSSQGTAASSEQPESASTEAKDRRIRGFENANDGRQDHQLYNGNSVSLLALRTFCLSVDDVTNLNCSSISNLDPTRKRSSCVWLRYCKRHVHLAERPVCPKQLPGRSTLFSGRRWRHSDNLNTSSFAKKQSLVSASIGVISVKNNKKVSQTYPRRATNGQCVIMSN